MAKYCGAFLGLLFLGIKLTSEPFDFVVVNKPKKGNCLCVKRVDGFLFNKLQIDVEETTVDHDGHQCRLLENKLVLYDPFPFNVRFKEGEIPEDAIMVHDSAFFILYRI